MLLNFNPIYSIPDSGGGYGGRLMELHARANTMGVYVE